MITADQLRDARIQAGFSSQAALAAALHVSERTVTNWEAEGGHVSSRAEARVRALLWPAPGPLASYSNYELLSEIGRRLDRSLGEASALPNQPLPEREEDPPNARDLRGIREENDDSLGETWINADPD